MSKEKSLLMAFLVMFAVLINPIVSVSAIIFSDTETSFAISDGLCGNIDCVCNIGCCWASHCGEDYYSDDYCLNDKLYRDFHDFSCQWRECIENITLKLVEDCGGDYCENWQYYCKENEVWKNRICYDKGCVSRACFSNETFQEIFVEKCNYKCENGKCIDKPEEPKCCDDFDCSVDYYGEHYCQDNDVYHDLHNFSRVSNECVVNIIKVLVQECSDLCLNGECIEIICEEDSDCGADGFVGEKYCQNNSVYQDYQTFFCENYGIINSSCRSSKTAKPLEECDYKCENGKCIEEEKEKEYKGGGRKLEIDYCGDSICDRTIEESEFNCPEDCEVYIFESSSVSVEEESNIAVNIATDKEAVKLGKGAKIIEDKSIKSLILISLIVFTVILLITILLVLIIKR